MDADPRRFVFINLFGEGRGLHGERSRHSAIEAASCAGAIRPSQASPLSSHDLRGPRAGPSVPSLRAQLRVQFIAMGPDGGFITGSDFTWMGVSPPPTGPATPPKCARSRQGLEQQSWRLQRAYQSDDRVLRSAIRYRRSRGESDSLSEMRWIPIALMGVHGLIHLMGFAKGFGYADLPQLTQPISRAWGLAWLAAALLVTTSAAMLGAGARSYWIPGAFGLVVSQAVIFSAWGDAWAGTVANVLLLLIVAFGWLTEGPRSFHAQYLRDAHAGLARVVADADRH